MPADPLFDKPYEPDPQADPVWERKGPASSAPPAGNGLSRFIKPKRKIAALLGGTGTSGPAGGGQGNSGGSAGR